MNVRASVVLLSTLALPLVSQAEEAPESVKALVPQLQAWGEDPVLIAAVSEQNASAMSLDDIQSKDQQWQATTGVDAFMQGLMENTAAQRMLELEQSQPYFLELFLMDNQGANVAMTNKTSDYWQGDEAKFTETFNGGSGAVHISDVEFDESSQAYLVQVAIPIVRDGNAIGALAIGINLDELE